MSQLLNCGFDWEVNHKHNIKMVKQLTEELTEIPLTEIEGRKSIEERLSFFKQLVKQYKQ